MDFDEFFDKAKGLPDTRHECCKEIEQLKAKNKRLREILEFYADKKNWTGRDGNIFSESFGFYEGEQVLEETEE